MESVILETHQLWGWSFFWKCSKFNLALKNAERNSENFFRFWDNCFWIGCLKMSLLGRKHLSSAVNMLTNILKTLHITKRDFSKLIAFTVINKCNKGGPVQIWTVFGPTYHVACQRPLKRHFLDINLTTFLEVRKFGNTSAMRIIFFWKMFKILDRFKKCRNKLRKYFLFLG